MFGFDEAIELAPLGPHTWCGEVSDRYNFGIAPNGGYLMALAAAAVGKEVGHPHPFTVTAHFLRRPRNALVEIEVEVVRTGRRLSTGSARFIQDGIEVLRATATFGDHGASSGPTMVAAAPPDLPPLEDLVSNDGFPGLPAVARQFRHHLTPASTAFALGVMGDPVIEGRTRFADGREADPLALLLISDSLPPPVLNVLPTTWVPTIEMTVHIRGIPQPGWLSFRFATRALVDGYLDEDGEIWDSTGRLMAVSRQLALIPPSEQG